MPRRYGPSCSDLDARAVEIEGGPDRNTDAVHHVVKRAQGGSDFDLDRLVALCPPCHAQTDAPYVHARLFITPLGSGRFTCEVIRGVDKWSIRA